MDPTWFEKPTDILAKLKARSEAKGHMNDPRYGPAVQAVEQYVQLGGRFVWATLTPQLIAKTLASGLPILTGTNGTYLYQCARETEAGPDDVRGDAFGHFIVLYGYRCQGSDGRNRRPAARQPGLRHEVLSRQRLPAARGDLSRRRLRRREPARVAPERLDEAERGQTGTESEDEDKERGKAEAEVEKRSNEEKEEDGEEIMKRAVEAPKNRCC